MNNKKYEAALDAALRVATDDAGKRMEAEKVFWDKLEDKRDLTGALHHTLSVATDDSEKRAAAEKVFWGGTNEGFLQGHVSAFKARFGLKGSTVIH